MLYVKKANLEDIEKEWAFVRDMPEDENGLTNTWHGISREDFEKSALPDMLRFERGENLPDWMVPETFLFLWEDEKFVGQFRIRHYLNDALREGGGHIGQFIAKEYRGKGYGTKGLALTLEVARTIVPEDEFYLRVNLDNPASLKVMQKNGGRIVSQDNEHYYVRIPNDKVITYAVSLHFSLDVNEIIFNTEKSIAEITGNNFMIENKVPPHITIGAFHAAKKDEEHLLQMVEDFSKTQNLGSIHFTDIGNFNEKVLFIKPEKDAFLTQINAELHKVILPEFEAGENGYYVPDIWFPHTILATRLNQTQFTKALEIAKKIPLPLQAKIRDIGVYQCSPFADLMLDSTFESAEALKSYSKHPEHVAVADSKVRPYTTSRACLDFEV